MTPLGLGRAVQAAAEFERARAEVAAVVNDDERVEAIIREARRRFASSRDKSRP